MAIYKFIDCDIYKRYISVFIGSRNDFKKWVEDTYGNDKEYQDLVELVSQSPKRTELASFWYNNKTGDGIIELPKFPTTPKDIAAIAHECFHAACQILDYCHIDYYPEGNNESFAYLIEHLVFNVLHKNDYKTF